MKIAENVSFIGQQSSKHCVEYISKVYIETSDKNETLYFFKDFMPMSIFWLTISHEPVQPQKLTVYMYVWVESILAHNGSG